MYTQNDFPIGSKAMVIATGEVVSIIDNTPLDLLRCKKSDGIRCGFHLSELEPVFEYGDDVEANGTIAKYYCPLFPEDCSYKTGYRHFILSGGHVRYIKFCRRASSRKSELLKQLEQAMEEERQATKKREELEKELETIK